MAERTRISPNKGRIEIVGHLLTRTQIRRLVARHGREVIEHRRMQIERCCYQHGNVTTFAHSVRVACLAVWMADRAHLWHRVDLKSLIRAALLHDYFLYDWHDWITANTDGMDSPTVMPH